jgi:hypothetical protein
VPSLGRLRELRLVVAGTEAERAAVAQADLAHPLHAADYLLIVMRIALLDD